MHRILDLRTWKWLRVEEDRSGAVLWAGWVRQKERATPLHGRVAAMDAMDVAFLWTAWLDGSVGIVCGDEVLVHDNTPRWLTPNGLDVIVVG